MHNPNHKDVVTLITTIYYKKKYINWTRTSMTARFTYLYRFHRTFLLIGFTQNTFCVTVQIGIGLVTTRFVCFLVCLFVFRNDVNRLDLSHAHLPRVVCVLCVFFFTVKIVTIKEVVFCACFFFLQNEKTKLPEKK